MKKYVLLLGLLIQAVSVLAQETSVGKSIFSVHAGPSWYLGKMIGITNNSDAYRNDLRNGIAWDANYYFLGDKYIFGSFKLAPGLIYQGGRYKNTHDESSDKILMHYIAPQLALFIPVVHLPPSKPGCRPAGQRPVRGAKGLGPVLAGAGHGPGECLPYKAI